MERAERAEASKRVFSKKNTQGCDGAHNCAWYTHIVVVLRSASIGSRVEHVTRGSAHHRGGASSIVWCVIVGVEGSGERAMGRDANAKNTRMTQPNAIMVGREKRTYTGAARVSHVLEHRRVIK